MDARAQLAQLIAQLSVVSHAPTQNLDGGSKSSDDDPLGRRPAGGIDRKDDQRDRVGVGWEDLHIFRQKSAEHFQARAKGCQTDGDYEAVLRDARAALEAWRRTPPVPGQDPVFGTLAWKRMIASSRESDRELARLHGCSRAYIWKVKRQYGEEAA